MLFKWVNGCFSLLSIPMTGRHREDNQRHRQYVCTFHFSFHPFKLVLTRAGSIHHNWKSCTIQNNASTSALCLWTACWNRIFAWKTSHCAQASQSYDFSIASNSMASAETWWNWLISLTPRWDSGARFFPSIMRTASARVSQDEVKYLSPRCSI